VSWFRADDYWLSRLVFERGLAAIYLVAFLVAVNQFRPLLGTEGILPIPRFVARVPFRRSPSLFHWRYSDRMFAATAWTGVALALITVVGLTGAAPLPLTMLIWTLLFLLYLSIVNVGQIWYGFGWESLLLETGFLAIFLGNADAAPPIATMFLLRWLLFRLEFGAGLIKMRGDRCWRDLTCLYYHHETQPMPGPLSWYFHQLPRPLHRVEVLANHITQLVVPFGLFAPQPVAGVAAGIMVATQLWLVVSGNFSWLNWMAIVLGISVLPDGFLRHVLPVSPPDHSGATPLAFVIAVLAVTALVLFMSYWPVRNMLGRHQLMNASFNRLHLVNTYGAFGSVTRVRREVVVEGTTDAALSPETRWLEYEFKGKPTDLRRLPRQFAPYHLRLDWLMWFAGISRGYADSWFGGFLGKLLQNDRPTVRLLRRNPFPDAPPLYVRALIYEYRFTTWREHRDTGEWWRRRLLGEYAAPTRLPTRTASATPSDR
jgi:Lipase maturation factor